MYSQLNGKWFYWLASIRHQYLKVQTIKHSNRNNTYARTDTNTFKNDKRTVEKANQKLQISYSPTSHFLFVLFVFLNINSVTTHKSWIKISFSHPVFDLHKCIPDIELWLTMRLSEQKKRHKIDLRTLLFHREKRRNYLKGYKFLSLLYFGVFSGVCRPFSSYL